MKKISSLISVFLFCCLGFFISCGANLTGESVEIRGTINLDDKYEVFFGMLDENINHLDTVVSIDKNGRFAYQFEIEKPRFIQVVIYPKARDRQLPVNFPLYVKPGTNVSLNLNYNDDDFLTLKEGEISSDNKVLLLYSNYRNLRARELFMNPPSDDAVIPFLKKDIEYSNQLIADFNIKEKAVKRYLSIWSLNIYLENARSLEYNKQKRRNISLDKYFDSLDGSPKEIFNYPEAMLFSDSYRNINAYIESINHTDRSNMTKTDKIEHKFKLFNQLFSNEQMQQMLYDRELRTYLEDSKIDENTNFEKELEIFSKLASYLSDTDKREALKQDFAKRMYSIPGASMPSVTFLDINGKEVALESFKGSYIYIDLWAAWCVPCIKEIPYLKKLAEDYKDKNIVFLSISIDKSSDDWKNKVKELQLEGNQLEVGNSGFEKMMNVKGIPHFILYDDKGSLKLYKAPRPSSQEIRDLFDAI